MAETGTLPMTVEPQAEQALALRAELTPDQLVERMDVIRSVMDKVMRKDIDYGIIPGCQKPSLLQPGAEKLCATFKLAPTYAVVKEWRPEMERPWEKDGYGGKKRSGICKGFIRYEINCTLIHGPSGTPIACGVGVANNWEPKFVSRDPYEVEESILQFARKRALVNAVRTGTAASSIFTQDMEDQPGAREERGAAGSPRDESSPSRPGTPSPPSSAGAPTPPPWHEDEMPFGKHKGVKFCDLPGDYLDWLSQRPPDPKYKPDVRTKAEGEIAYRKGSVSAPATPAASQVSYPAGFGADIPLRGGKYPGVKLRDVPDGYLKRTDDKAPGVWGAAANIEIERRKQVCQMFIAEPPTDRDRSAWIERKTKQYELQDDGQVTEPDPQEPEPGSLELDDDSVAF